MATLLMTAAHQALALTFLDQEQLERWQLRAIRIHDWGTLFHAFLPTNVPRGLALENMVVTLSVPCSQEYADHEIYEMMHHPAPLRRNCQHGVANKNTPIFNVSIFAVSIQSSAPS
jgi:hypothetical protein